MDMPTPPPGTGEHPICLTVVTSGDLEKSKQFYSELFSWTLMPTLRLMVPMGSFEPYASVGLGYGWLPDAGREGVAAMGRLGFVYRFSERFAIGLEGTLQQVDGSSYRFASFGSMVSFHL